MTNGRFVDEYRLTAPDGRSCGCATSRSSICDDDGQAALRAGVLPRRHRAARTSGGAAARARAVRPAGGEHRGALLRLGPGRAAVRLHEPRVRASHRARRPRTCTATRSRTSRPSIPTTSALVTPRGVRRRTAARGTVEFRYHRPTARSAGCSPAGSRWSRTAIPFGSSASRRTSPSGSAPRQALEEERFRFAQLASSLRAIFTILDVDERAVPLRQPRLRGPHGPPGRRRCTTTRARSLTASIPTTSLPAIAAGSALLAGEESEFEFRYVRPDGTSGWAWNRRYPIVEDGAVRQVIGFTEDITDRKLRAAPRSTRSACGSQQLVENISDVFWVYDLEERRHVFIEPAVRAADRAHASSSSRADPSVFLACGRRGRPAVVLADGPSARPGRAERGRVPVTAVPTAPCSGSGTGRSRSSATAGSSGWRASPRTSPSASWPSRRWREQQERFRQLAEASTGVFWVYDLAARPARLRQPGLGADHRPARCDQTIDDPNRAPLHRPSRRHRAGARRQRPARPRGRDGGGVPLRPARRHASAGSGGARSRSSRTTALSASRASRRTSPSGGRSSSSSSSSGSASSRWRTTSTASSGSRTSSTTGSST